MPDLTGLLPQLHDRREYFDHLEGYSVDVKDELVAQRLTRGLVKTYILETVRNGETPPLQAVLEAAGVGARQVDESLLVLTDPTAGRVALLETLDARHPVVYTLLDADVSDPWVRRLVDRSPWLDHLWLSSPLFHELWRYVERVSPPHRKTRLTFEHEGVFERGFVASVLEPDAAPAEFGVTPEPVEGKFSRVTISDSIDTIRRILPRLQEAYSPLNSIVQLRIPATGRGGHDFYFDGKVTNRSDSFADHRLNVQLVVDVYRQATDAAEQTLWFAAVDAGETGFSLNGAPVFFRFSTPLDGDTFERWIQATFGRRRNRFRLGGQPMRLGPRKVHVYGIDRHLWQPVSFEITDRHILGVLPKGTCGNTVHRLVTNIQRWLDPDVRAWIGDQPYASLMEHALPGKRAS